MAKRKNIHVAPHPDGGWQVKREGTSRASSLHRLKQDAYDKALRTAKRERLELIVHNYQGQIIGRENYCPDPHPVRTVKRSARVGKVSRVAVRRAVREVTRGRNIENP